MTSVSVVGLGAMGRPIARNLMGAGFDVTVWNRSPEAVAELVAEGATGAKTVAEAFQSGVVLSMLADDSAVSAAILDPAVLASVPTGTVHVNMATVSVGLAKRAAALHAEYGIGYIAAPVFGRVSVAQAGQLNIIAGGDSSLLERVQPFLDVIGARTWPQGERPEQANIVKIIGNYLILAAIQSLGEAITLGERSGVDGSQLVELLTSTIFPGPVYSSYGNLVATRQYEPAGFTTTLGLKDLRLALDAADSVDLDLPFGGVLRSVLAQALANGQGEMDWASIAELVRSGQSGEGSPETPTR